MTNQKKNYSPNKEIRIKTSMLRSDLCNFSVVVEGTITLEGDNNANKRNKNLAFKNNAPFINCISKINGVKIDNAEDLDVVMPMYNLIEYSKNYRKQAAYGVITEMNQVIRLLLILNLIDTKQALQEVLIILVMGKKGMMQTKLVKIKLKLLFH